MRAVLKSPRAAVATTLAVLAVALAPPAHAAEETVAQMRATAGRIVFRPVVEYARLKLTVSGEGWSASRTFDSGQEVSLELVDRRGKPLPDGRYQYELTVDPRVDPAGRKAVAEVRASQDPEAAARWKEKYVSSEGATQTGSFAILAGAIVDGSTKEPEPRRDPEREGDVLISGSMEAGGKKSFVMTDPLEPGRILRFVALEGPEAGTYFRGSAKLVAGEAVIELPEAFVHATEPEGLTVQLTPIGAWSRLYVASKSLERLVVRSAEGSPEVHFDVLVHGVRRGYADHRPIEP